MILISRIYNILFFRPFIRFKLKKAGKNLKIGHNSEFYNPQFFEIGNDFFSGPYSYFVTNKNNPVKIGDSVMFGPFCKIIGGNHDLKYNKNHMRFNSKIDHFHAEIVLENGVWVGANTTILSNTKLSEGAVVGAQSLVNKYVPPYTISAGCPIKIIKPRFDSVQELKEILTNVNSKYSIEEIQDIYTKYNFSLKWKRLEIYSTKQV